MKPILALAAAAAMTFAVTPAQAVETVTARDPQTVVDALAEMGYRATLEKLDSGRTSISVPMSGVNTYVDFYDCADDMSDCYTLLFDLNEGTTLSKANQWNAAEITGRVSLDDNGDPQLDYAVSTFEGIPFPIFEQTVKLWDRKIGQMKDFFDF